MVSCVAKRSTENSVQHRIFEAAAVPFRRRHSEIEYGQIGLDCCVSERLVSSQRVGGRSRVSVGAL